MHDKFIVVVGETGSFNFSSSAESRNAENVVVLHDAAVAQRYGPRHQPPPPDSY
jgi:phosphatidylserine/phosphatidylglycerophosphate/cardiolipin synthase-like enzyme